MPASPSPGTRRRMPSSTPAGMRTFRVFCPSRRPLPRQVGQGSLTTQPEPAHGSQGRLIRNRPCWKIVWPVPRQRGQRSGAVPARAPEPLQVSQRTMRGTWICRSRALEQLDELDLEVVAEVGAALAARAAAAARAEEIAEQVAEDVGEALEVHAREALARAAPTPWWPKRS